MERSQLTTWIEKSRQGDPEAQEKLVREAQNRVYYHCKKFLKNEQDAQDAAQDVLIAMITSLDKLKEPAAFWGWLNGITANRCKHLLSRSTKEWQIPEDEEGNSMLDSVETLDDQTVPDKVLDNAETQRLVTEIVDALPPEQRMTVTFFYYDEMPVKEIAAAMGVSEGTVKSRLNYARKTIRLEVEKLEKKDGTKLYSVSILPFLAYFLRRGAQSEALSPAAAQALTKGVMAAARPVAAASVGTAAGAAAGTSAGATAAGAATAVAAKAAAGLSVKLIAGALAGVLALGGVGAGVYMATHRDGRAETETEDEIEAVSPEVEEPTPEPTPVPAYAAAYARKVQELSGELGEEARYGLLFIDDDDIPELTASYFDGSFSYINLYTATADGALVTVTEALTSGRMGVPLYYPGKNAVVLPSSDATGATETYYRLTPEGTLEQFDHISSDHPWGIDDPNFTRPEGLEELAVCSTEGAMTSQELLEELGVDEDLLAERPAEDTAQPSEGQGYIPGDPLVNFDFSPYVGTYTPDQQMVESYSSTDWVADLTLYSDGALSDGALAGRVMSEGEPPSQLLSGNESKGGSGSYTLMLIDEKTQIEDSEIPVREYYIIYPAGVSDRYGGDSAKVRILYADLTGGAWEMLFTKVD